MSALPLNLTSTITTEGYAAAVSNVPDANGFKINLTQIQPVVNGVPQGYFEATGVSLGDGQVRVRANVTSDAAEYGFDEVWIYDGNSQAIFCKVKRTDGGILDYVSPYKRSVINYNIKFATLPAGTVTILADNGQSVALAALDEHIRAADPHPQYQLKGQGQTQDAGKLAFFAQSVAPQGYLKANGAEVSRTAYATLYDSIGIRYGAGDGSSTFNLPDGRGLFLRGFDDGRGIDLNRSLGSLQDNQNRAHIHSIYEAGAHSHSAWTDEQGNHGHTAWTDAQGQHQHYVNITPLIGLDNGGEGQIAHNFGNTTGSTYGVSSDAAGNHGHNVGIGVNGLHAHNVGINGVGDHAHGMDYSGGSESRPTNLAFLLCIKY